MSLDPTDRIRHLAREWYAGERAWGEVQETFWELLTLQNAHEVLAASPWSLHDVIGGHASPFVWEVSTLRSGASFTLLKETETQPDIWDVRARNLHRDDRGRGVPDACDANGVGDDPRIRRAAHTRGPERARRSHRGRSSLARCANAALGMAMRNSRGGDGGGRGAS